MRIPRFRKGDKKPDERWYNAVADALEGPPIEADASAGLTLAQVGTRWVLSLVLPALVFPAVAGSPGAAAATTTGAMTSGSATLYVPKADGTMTSTGQVVTYWHWGSAGVTAGARLILVRLYGLFFVIWEDCPSA